MKNRNKYAVFPRETNSSASLSKDSGNDYLWLGRMRIYYAMMTLLSLFAYPSLAQTVCPPAAELNQITPCYVNGARSQSAAEPAIVLFNHTTSRGTSATKQVIATISEVGSVWGMAWKAQTKQVYAAAFVKRHCDLPPDGIGAIYEIDVTTPTTAGAGAPTLWMNLNSLVHLGAGATLFPSETSANRGLGSPLDPNRDEWAYDRVGKQGIGDIEISEDGATMFVMDLTNRQVLAIDMASKTVTNRYPISAPAGYVNPQDRRPFAIKHHKGELYVGMVNSGETGEVKANLRATVLQLVGGVFTEVLNLVDNWAYRDWPLTAGFDWRAYHSTHKASFTTGFAYNQWPVPMISDIEFDANDNMIVGIMDWTGHRYGNANYSPVAGDSGLYRFQSHGEVLKATKNGASWTVESPLGTFFNDMTAIPSQSGWPTDTFVGGLVTSSCSGLDLVSANMQDPYTSDEGGVIWMKSSDGLMQTNPGGQSQTAADSSRMRIYWGGPGYFGKASGLGDMVITHAPQALCDITDLVVTPGVCNDNGTPADATDDYYTASVAVTFSDKPSTGNLVLSGVALHSSNSVTTVPVGSTTSATTHTFVGVRLKANGVANAITATFSADSACTMTINSSSVPSCSTPVDCCPQLIIDVP